MKKKWVQFHDTMSADKRDPNACYLRYSVLPNVFGRGFYPKSNFYDLYDGLDLGANDQIVKILPKPGDSSIKAIVFTYDYAEKKTKIFAISYAVTQWALNLKSTINNLQVVDAVDGANGIRFIGDGGELYKCDYDGTNPTLLHDLGNGSNEDRIIHDGTHYFWLKKKAVYRFLDTETPTKVLNKAASDDIFGMIVYENYIVFASRYLNGILISFWGKDDPDLMDKKVIVPNSEFLGIGVIQGVLVLMHSVGNTTNIKEAYGLIKASGFNGQFFEELVSVKSGDVRIYNAGYKYRSYDAGNSIMLVGVSGNENLDSNADLYKNYVYKVSKVHGRWAIETVFYENADIDGGVGDNVHAVGVCYAFSAIGVRNETVGRTALIIDWDQNDDYDEYYPSNYNESVYITNFLDFTGSKHKLGGIGISFEKLFDNGYLDAELDIYYRTSEREDWNLIKTIKGKDIKDDIDARQSQTVKDAEYSDDNKGLNIQEYVITKMPDGSAFKEYYEIQFKLVSRKGFSVIDFWYYVDEVKRRERI